MYAKRIRKKKYDVISKLMSLEITVKEAIELLDLKERQITNRSGMVKDFHFSTSKSSIRTLPINKILLEDLKTQKMKILKFMVLMIIIL